MTLTELCDPVFQYICRLNRSARKGGGAQSLNQVRNEVKALLDDVMAKARRNPALMAPVDPDEGGIYHILLFFVNYMIRTSGLSFASRWQNLEDPEHPLGDETKFFKMLDDTIADSSDAATERLVIYYTCIGLGFTGWSEGKQEVFRDPQFLRQQMQYCRERLRERINADELICSDAYNADPRILFKRVRSSLVGMTLVLIVLVGAVLVINAFQYYQKSQELSDTLDRLTKLPDKEGSAKPAGPTTSPTTHTVAGSS